ncbi:TBC1 domain family member 30 isoform X2 [Stigmatopora argus]
MESDVQWNGGQVLEDDICERSEDFSGFQRWIAPVEYSPTFPPPPPPAPAPPSLPMPLFLVADPDEITSPRTSIVDCLLVELYDTYGGRRNVDSWDSSTEASGPEAFQGRCNAGSGFLQELQEKHTRRHQVNYLSRKGPEELVAIIQEVKYRTGVQSAKLIRQLRRRDRLVYKLQKNYDIITACLQAVSQKRRVDTRLKFTIEPSVGKNGFQQWYDALKAVARLPTGIPKEWRKRVWLTLADQYLHSISIDWDKTLRFAFNERSNPDDDSLGVQIVKDLHRTGCSSYCGQEGELDRVVLKRVLLAYARWNKTVGYCQGFNVLAALILVVTQGDESDALKLMIYLIDKVLPESYFANNLRALSVDMAVFRDLLRVKLPRLSRHLHRLQREAYKEAGGSYEPPLTNVFTMQWFLTMFATCLPAPAVLKIWDSVFFEGSEVLFRVALAIWERLGERILCCQTADDFYSTMGRLTREMLERRLVDPARLMQEVYGMAAFPFPQLAELREKYTYNITPFPASLKLNGSGWESDDEAVADDDAAVAAAVLGCLGPLGGLLAPEVRRHQQRLKDVAELSAVGGGAGPEHEAAVHGALMERTSTDVHALKKQYARIKRRQQQQSTRLCVHADKCPGTRVSPSQLNPSGAVINHLLLGRKARGAPPISRARGSRHSDGSVSSAGSREGAASPWRAHVRAHRQNAARARPGSGESEPLDEESGESEAADGVPSEPHAPAEVEEVRLGLRSAGLEDPDWSPTLDTRPVPLLSSTAQEVSNSEAVATVSSSPESPSSSSAPVGGFSETRSPSAARLSWPPPGCPASSSPAAKPQMFSPFPCVKLPRKSAAARSLGLYGPSSRTPAVSFPQLSRHLSGTPRRR